MATESAIGASLAEEAFQDFAGRVRGAVLLPGQSGYDDARAIWNGLIDRQPGADRPVHGRSGRRRRGELRARAEPAALDQGRRSQRRRQRGERRRPRDRPVADAWRPRRPVDPDGAGTGWRDMGRHRPRVPAVRARGARRRRLDHGHRRPDAPRRLRPSATQVRAVPRQPPLRRHRHGRRAAAPGERDRERRPLLGRPRRRQQLRRRDVVRVPGAPGRPDGDGRRDLLPAGRCEERGAGLARLHGIGAGGAQLDRALLERPAARALPARGSRGARPHRRRRVLPEPWRTPSPSCSRCASSPSP